MALSEIDRSLLQRCLTRQPRAWEDFVDRFLGLVMHVVNHTTITRNLAFSAADAEDLVADVFYGILADDFAVLRRFRGESSLATYLTVVSRRIVVRELLKRRLPISLTDTSEMDNLVAGGGSLEQRVQDREEVEKLIDQLGGEEAHIVRLYHLEGKTYGEISKVTGVPENSIGPTLSRARAKMRRQNVDSAAG